jgi:hypothetical protein
MAYPHWVVNGQAVKYLILSSDSTMKYKITWENNLVRVDYFGEIDNKDIEEAHFELNGDGRFYDCDFLVLDISKCDLRKVSVPKLTLVIATDLGATKTNKSLKVAMIATHQANIEKASSYIEKNKSLGTPWEFKLLSSNDEARAWFNA